MYSWPVQNIFEDGQEFRADAGATAANVLKPRKDVSVQLKHSEGGMIDQVILTIKNGHDQKAAALLEDLILELEDNQETDTIVNSDEQD